ncbi:MAG: hypothetical protein A2513_09300 [Sulfurimonas sp. RIFOXYD12_FULL_33_39]|uniref:hypothetical protein n=1 Tax=unclassified Sulfurimonas TaxID=2623549 RepID=UPI0008C18CB2|nr:MULTISPECIES: hypothetical protein [unclassified Sulfurimonas]OHE05691.1 MAG: hypothetical protein A3G74_06240 [Sulfurimonas sp. RIFCSPLOWO2_12_FULL_34_6]OHE10649.1 MAG: hypothetical protein A2513_09300 [Sulfurimonas sp. RIFOXYD12_FULL_33_39]OHE13162.1 MAG: hypothetical protein A2530_10890 [Sulfurimonas sp. RIFOXYD2_FULL_34_21]DAB27496.1 MAG TPA: hypothetical protein CFH78_07755 [Sulfurimonas sp. UBA10385]
MAYFDNAKVNDKVYGLVFGAGKIAKIFDESHYKIMVDFKNGYEVPYTEDGIPGWGNFNKQTLFYKNDVDLTDVDFSPVTKVLSVKKIIKLREKKKLQVRLPSGVWKNVKKAELSYIEELLEKEKYHMFRKKPDKNKK